MRSPPQLKKSWSEALKDEWEKPYMSELARFLVQERAASFSVYPPKHEVFNAFNHTSFDQTQVVVVGQDPYHGPRQAHGLSFSVSHSIAQPPSLKNIFKELKEDLAIEPPNHGNLEGWAKQGILLLNAVLTVRAHQPRSHCGKGWEKFTDAVISKLNTRKDPIIFVLWGKTAQEKCVYLADHHHVLKAAHPSPYSAHNGFFGCSHFSKINKLLIKQTKKPINWSFV